jgi:hypothetical protein
VSLSVIQGILGLFSEREMAVQANFHRPVCIGIVPILLFSAGQEPPVVTVRKQTSASKEAADPPACLLRAFYNNTLVVLRGDDIGMELTCCIFFGQGAGSDPGSKSRTESMVFRLLLRFLLFLPRGLLGRGYHNLHQSFDVSENERECRFACRYRMQDYECGHLHRYEQPDDGDEFLDDATWRGSCL